MQDHEKVEIIKKLKLDYYFDDKPEVLNTLINQKLKAIIRDQSYNQHSNLPRIKNWSDLSGNIKSKTVTRKINDGCRESRQLFIYIYSPNI